MSSAGNYFSSMLQRMILEAHGVDDSPASSVAPSNEEKSMMKKIVQTKIAEKKRNLEQNIQRLKMSKVNLGGAEERETPSEERGSTSADSSDEVDVVGGVGPTASEIHGGFSQGLGVFASEIDQQRPSGCVKAPLECNRCGKICGSPFQLKEHIAIQHLNERNFACEQCDQKFGRRGGLRRHVLMVHQNHLHKCPYADCDHPGYKCSKALTAHIRSVHTNIRPFVCNECQKSFVRKNDLKMHQITHVKECSFICICGSRFRRQMYLRKHQKTCKASYDDEPLDLVTRPSSQTSGEQDPPKNPIFPNEDLAADGVRGNEPQKPIFGDDDQFCEVLNVVPAQEATDLRPAPCFV